MWPLICVITDLEVHLGMDSWQSRSSSSDCQVSTLTLLESWGLLHMHLQVEGSNLTYNSTALMKLDVVRN